MDGGEGEVVVVAGKSGSSSLILNLHFNPIQIERRCIKGYQIKAVLR